MIVLPAKFETLISALYAWSWGENLLAYPKFRKFQKLNVSVCVLKKKERAQFVADRYTLLPPEVGLTKRKTGAVG